MRLLTLLLVVSLLGCATSIQSTAPLTLAIPMHRAPATTFDFCSSERPDAPLHLGNVAWLAFMSANEYSHANVFGPVLASLGFTSPQGRDLDWRSCTTDLRKLRTAQAGREPELSAVLGTEELRSRSLRLLPDVGLADWGDCARTFLSREDLRRDAFPAAAFQEALMREVRHGSYLQFFTAGGVTEDKTAFHDSSTQVVFARHRDKPIAILAFRGTEPSQRADVLADLKTWKTPLADHGWPAAWGEVHTGFVEAYASVAPLVEQKLAELDGSGVRVYVTGHSLGGALATLAFARMLRADAPAISLAGLVTFGSPRVGDAAFAATFRDAATQRGARVLRVRNGDDAVTRLPGLVLEYEHVGTLVHVEENKLAVDPDPEPAYEGSSIADHDISGFAESLEWKSGYYRRLLFAFQNRTHPELARCDEP